MPTGPRSIAVLACAGALAAFAAAPAAAAEQPNIVVIQTDDQNVSDLTSQTMPNVTRAIVEEGTRFSNYTVATPQCCPSRAALMTGDYPHNDGVFNNSVGYLSLNNPESTLPSWLQAAGYRTAHVGKFMNRYDDTSGSIAIPAPGWDDWFSVPDSTRYYNYTLGDNGVLRHFGSAPKDYVTTVLNRHAVRIVRDWSAGRRPFYLQLDERAPHDASMSAGSAECSRGPIPAPADVDRYASKRLPRSPGFNEADMSDKPALIQQLPPLTHTDIKQTTKTYRCRLESLREVDRGVGAIRKALQKTHSLTNTVLVFLSDNGFFSGEHRIAHGKIIPYEEALRQPLAIRLPPADRPKLPVAVVPAAVSNIDIAPTLLRLADAQPCNSSGDCRTLDGRSLAPLLQGHEPSWSTGRSLLLEYADPQVDSDSGAGICAYAGIQRVDRTYVHYTSAVPSGQTSCQPTDQTETYDLTTDPFQLQNLFPATPDTPEAAEQSSLATELGVLADCAGIKGRDPLPPSGHYCD
jgi:N-acetylglucosamine-6-sulfatase